MPLLVQTRERIHSRVETQIRVDFVHISGLEGQRRTVSYIFVVRVWDHGVETIVASGQLNDHEDRIAVIGRNGARRRGANQKIRRARCERQHR